jgi:hypothetical protein
MFAGKVSMHLKGSVPEFTQTLEREVLRKQEGFRDEITFVAPRAYAEVTKVPGEGD